MAGSIGSSGFYWDSDSGMQSVRFGIAQTFPSEINDNGMVVGMGFSDRGREAYTWTREGGAVGLGYPSTSAGSEAGCINNAEQMNLARHSFYKDPDGEITELIPFAGGGEDNIAWDINSNKQIVGNIGVLNGLDPSCAYVWDPLQGMRNLNENLDASGNGYWVLAGYGINDKGQITGGALLNGKIHAVLLNPIVPEPSTLLLFVVSSSLIVLKKRTGK